MSARPFWKHQGDIAFFQDILTFPQRIAIQPITPDGVTIQRANYWAKNGYMKKLALACIPLFGILHNQRGTG